MNEQMMRRVLRRIERQQHARNPYGGAILGDLGDLSRPLPQQAGRAGSGASGASGPGAFPTAREIAEEEQDRQRTALAARLLEIVFEDAGWQPLRRRLDGETSAKEAIGDFEILAKAAIAAAMVIYPELPPAAMAQESGSEAQEPGEPSPIGEGEIGRGKGTS